MIFGKTYLRKFNLLMMAGSFALPAQTWKKQMISTTASTMNAIAAAMGTMIVQKSSAVTIPSNNSTTAIFSA